MSDDNKDLINKIENIEKQLRELRIELGARMPTVPQRPTVKTGPYEIGEEVVILNPKAGQGTSGKLRKVNLLTRFVTIDTLDSRGRKEKTVRSFGKIRRKINEE